MATRWDQRVCLAAAFLIADRISADRSAVHVVEIPEEETQTAGKKVELVCTVGDDEIAFEHTQIESFKDQIQDGQHINDFMGTVTRKLPEELPAGTFTLGVATDAVLGLRGKASDAAADELADWIAKNAPEMADNYNYMNPPSHSRGIESSIEGTMWFRPGDHPRKLQFARSTPDALEDERAARIKTAYEAKLPKLSTEREKGRPRCLVLENCDTPLGNAMLIRSAALTAIEGLQDVQPEWILLVDTEIDPAEWLVLATDGVWPDFDASEFSPIEIPRSLDT